MATYTLKAEVRNGLVYIELLQNDDTFRGTLSRRFRNIVEAETAVLDPFRLGLSQTLHSQRFRCGSVALAPTGRLLLRYRDDGAADWSIRAARRP